MLRRVCVAGSDVLVLERLELLLCAEFVGLTGVSDAVQCASEGDLPCWIDAIASRIQSLEGCADGLRGLEGGEYVEQHVMSCKFGSCPLARGFDGP